MIHYFLGFLAVLHGFDAFLGMDCSEDEAAQFFANHPELQNVIREFEAEQTLLNENRNVPETEFLSRLSPDTEDGQLLVDPDNYLTLNGEGDISSDEEEGEPDEGLSEFPDSDDMPNWEEEELNENMSWTK